MKRHSNTANKKITRDRKSKTFTKKIPFKYQKDLYDTAYVSPLPNSPKHDRKQSHFHIVHKKIFSTLIAISISVVTIVNIYLGLTLFTNKIKIENTESTQENISRQISQLIDDTKELRKTMDLPTFFYEDDLVEDPNPYSEDIYPQDENLTERDILYQQIESIYDDYNKEKVSSNFSQIIEKHNIQKQAQNYNFIVQQKNTKLIIRYKGFIIASIDAIYDADYTITKLRYESPIMGNMQELEVSLFPEIIAKLNSSLQKNIAYSKEIYAAVNKLFTSNEITNLIRNNRSYSRFFNNDEAYIWRIYNITDQEIFYVEISKFSNHISTNRNALNGNQSLKIIVNNIEKEIINTNYKTIEENISYNNLNRLISYASDKSFQKELQSIGLNFSTQTRNDADYYYLDISTSQGTKVGSLGILKANGSFWRLDRDDVPISQISIFDVMPPKELAKAEEQYILLVGSHNKLADTIIIAHISPENKIKLISVPRDLYYQGRKINWYFKRFSPPNFNKIISKITGLPISQYIYVDMYAFVSIIDTLGGIQVYLKAPLVDTSYKIKENGQISYLNYDAGEHYLSGIEALRVARSRYSTNDFNRSVRQQAILEGIQKKINSVDQLSSFISIIKVIDNIRAYIDTNITNFEIAKMAQKYRNAQITDKRILSTQNVLYTTYSNVYNKTIPESELEPEDRGQWILLPKNNDWNILHNYIESFILE